MLIITKRTFAALLFIVSAGCILAFPGPSGNIFGNITIKKTPLQEAAERRAKERDAEITDSLLRSIKIDRLTRDTYRMFPPFLYSPRILGGLDEAQYPSVSIPAPSYSSLAGVICGDCREEGVIDNECNKDSCYTVIYPAKQDMAIFDPIPEWFKKSLRFQNQIHDASRKMLISNPAMVEFADWNLPEPPRIPAEDFSFRAFLRRMNLPEISTEDAIIPEVEIKRRNWLHTLNIGLQLSQAYVSPNWYQGGNSYVSGLFNFNWNVELNTVFHPTLLFQSSLEYKLAVNSNPKGSLHKYNTSQDLFQYNLKTGLKAFNHWFYSLNLLFTTQLFNSYPEDSLQRQSTFLSPGTLNIGLGMTYSLTKKGATLTATVSPLAYNLKTCIANDIDHEQFNIKQNRKTLSEIGSSAEVNLTWKFTDNISWKSRLFLFTDYSYFLADWENTFNFQLNRFLSTQIYLHPRFDGSSEYNAKWRHWMLREVLSFGISYTFATPK